MTPNDLYMSHTAPLTSKRCILYIYSTNVGTEYFKHALYSPFFSLHNAVCFIMLTFLVPELFTFYIHNQSINQSIHWHEQNAVIPCRSQEPPPYSLSYTFSCHPSPPTILPSSLTSSSHLFLGLPLGLIVSKFMYNTLLEILFSFILCTCPNQHNLCSLIVSVIVGFLARY